MLYFSSICFAGTLQHSKQFGIDAERKSRSLEKKFARFLRDFYVRWKFSRKVVSSKEYARHVESKLRNLAKIFPPKTRKPVAWKPKMKEILLVFQAKQFASEFKSEYLQIENVFVFQKISFSNYWFRQVE